VNRTQFPRLGETCFETELDNGLTICVIPRPGYLKSYAFFATGYGGMNLRFRTEDGWQDSPAGVAHFLEHKMFDTKEGNALQILTANGASPNAFTMADMTGYYFECTEGFAENLRTLLSFVSQPYFTQESVAKEQGIIGQEIQMIEDNPDWRLYQNLLRALYRNNPLRIPLAGSKNSIAEITADTLYQCHRAFYHPGNMVLCVVGDVDPEQVAAIAQDVLPQERRDRAEKDLGAPEPDAPAERQITEVMAVSSPNFLLGLKARPHPAGEEDLRLQLLGDLAGDILAGESSPLYAKLYSEGLIDKSFFVSYESSPGTAFLMLGGESKQVEPVTEAILDEGARLRREGINPDLFRRCKKAAYGSRVRALNSMDHVGTRLAAGKLKGYHYYRFADLYDTIALEDIQAFLDGLIRQDCAALSVVTPKGTADA
jgi:predicted Zn-dependent peptidase